MSILNIKISDHLSYYWIKLFSTCEMKEDHDHYVATFYDIERKTKIALERTWKITMLASEQARCEDIDRVVGCVGDLDRSSQIPGVEDSKKLSKIIPNAILDNPKLKPHKTVIHKENDVIPRSAKKNNLNDISLRKYNIIILTSQTGANSQKLYLSTKY